MSLILNLLEFRLDQSATITVFHRPYDDTVPADRIRAQLAGNQIVTRLGDLLWGYMLPKSVVEQYAFQPEVKSLADLDPRFVNGLLRNGVERRLEDLGFQKAGFDKFEHPGEIAFSLGSKNELIARPRWMVRPFSLPSDGNRSYTLFVNPRLAYRFKQSLAELQEFGLLWQEFGEGIRAAVPDQAGDESAYWEMAHTALVVEDEGEHGLICEWRDGERHLVSLPHCWLLANTENRYHYLRRRYLGRYGEQLSKSLKAKEDDFFALDKVQERISRLAKLIDSIQVGEDLRIKVGDFLQMSVVSPEFVAELQPRSLSEIVDDVETEETASVSEDDDPEEFIQLSLF